MDITDIFNKDPELFRQLEEKGIISSHHIRDMEIYAKYKRLKKDYPKKMQLYNKLSIDTNLSVETIRRMIKKYN